MMTEKDIESLPPVVQMYLRYVGAVGKPIVYNVKIEFDGEMRDRGTFIFKYNRYHVVCETIQKRM